MKHFQSKVLTAAILAALSGSAIAADVYLKDEVYNKDQVNTEINNAKTAVEEKINAAKKELGDKLDKQKDSDSKEIEKVKTAITRVKNLLVGDPKDDQNPGLIDSISDLNKTVNGDVDEESGNKKTPGLVDTVAELDKSVKSNKSEIGELKTGLADTNTALDKTTNALNEAEEKVTAFADETKKNIEATNEKLNDVAASVDSHEETLKEIATSLDETDTKADEAVKTANEAKNVADETKQNVDAKIKAATDAAGEAKTAAGEAKTAAGEAKKVAEKVTDIEEAAEVALVAAHKNTQDIHGFKAGDIIYKKDKNGKIIEKEATQKDVDNDDFEGKGLKEVVAEHDKNFETVSEALEETAKVIDQHTNDLTAVKTAINKNEDAINDTKDDLALVAQDINGFKAGEDIYVIDEKGNVTSKKATQEDVNKDDFGGLGLKEVVKANKAAIVTKAEKTDLKEVSDKVTAAEGKITAAEGKITAAEGKITAAEGKLTAAEGKLTAAEGKLTAAEGKITAAEKSITEHGMRLNGLDKTVSDLRKETRQGLAEQAALSGLFQPYNVGRFNVTAAVGGYKSESAVAIGTGFRFTENFAAKAGVAVGTSSGSSAAYHVGVNYEW